MSASTIMVLLIIVGAGVTALIAFRASPRLAFVAWCVTLFFVPVWVGASVGAFVPALSAATAAVIASNLHRMRLVIGDAVVLLFALLTVLLFGAGEVTLSSTFTAVMEYVLPYAWGRIVLARLRHHEVIGWLAAFATAAAALALLEFASGVNPFVLIPGSGSAYQTWAPLQLRGGFVRAEGAFGHSIALGSSLAMASAFVHLARWRGAAKVAALTVIGGAVVLTFSRIGLLTFAVTTVLSVLLLRQMSRGWRILVLLAGLVATIVLVPFVSDVLLDAGAEAAGSAAYRTDLLVLLPQAEWLGAADGWQTRVVDGVYLGRFARSIDNTIILMLLRYGILPTAVLLLGLVGLVVAVLRPGRASPPAVAVVAQIPALFSVALITQYGMLLWFLTGLAVSWWHQRSEPEQAHLADDRIVAVAGAPDREGRRLTAASTARPGSG